MERRLEKILLVEDDPDIAFLVGMTLKKLGGFDVRHADCGLSALKIIDGFAPDLVVLDVMMPQMDGPETLRHIRMRPPGAEVPAVFMTARVQNHEIQTYLDLGAIGVITKPIKSDTLCETLRGLWETYNAGQRKIEARG